MIINTENDMTSALATLMTNIKNDYMFKDGTTDSQIRMTQEFNENLSYNVGRKYIKVMTKSSVWGFIVNVDDDKKFAKGDLLMAAGYNAPARNKPRGNILKGGYKVNWTGPLYL
jgi:hypothetical protein